MFTSIGIAIDRFWAISYPILYRSQISKKFTILLIVEYWILGFANTTLLFIKGIEEVHRFSCIILALLSFIVFVSLNINIYFKLKNRLKCSTNINRLVKREMRLTETIRIIFAVYCFLLLPFFIVEFFLEYENEIFGLLEYQDFCCKLKEASRMFVILNCAMNPLIYAYRVKAIRDRIKEILKCSRVQSSLNSSHPSELVSSSIRINTFAI